MNFLIADTFTDSLARLTGDEQKAVKTTAFDPQMDQGWSQPRSSSATWSAIDWAWGGHVAWRLPLEHTDIEIHEVESSRRITATSFRVTRPLDRPRITQEVHATLVVGGTEAWLRWGR